MLNLVVLPEFVRLLLIFRGILATILPNLRKVVQIPPEYLQNTFPKTSQILSKIYSEPPKNALEKSNKLEGILSKNPQMEKINALNGAPKWSSR